MQHKYISKAIHIEKEKEHALEYMRKRHREQSVDLEELEQKKEKAQKAAESMLRAEKAYTYKFQKSVPKEFQMAIFANQMLGDKGVRIAESHRKISQIEEGLEVYRELLALKRSQSARRVSLKRQGSKKKMKSNNISVHPN